jgi:hypothetical protein
MPEYIDGPSSPLFTALPFKGNVALDKLAPHVSPEMARSAVVAPTGNCVCWGLPFSVDKPLLLKDKPVTINLAPFKANWLVFMHTTDRPELDWNEHGFISPTHGGGRLKEKVADYVLVYADGTEARHPILRRYHINMYRRNWGENCFECVPFEKPFTVRPLNEQQSNNPHGGPGAAYGWTTTRAAILDLKPWMNWLWAWENPQPGSKIVAVRFEPAGSTVVVSGISAGKAQSYPLRWEPRRKAVLKLPKGTKFDPTLNPVGILKQLRIDLGQIISAQPRRDYDNAHWAASYNNKVPALLDNEVLVEYAAHPEARFHLADGKQVPVEKLEQTGKAGSFTVVPPSRQRVTLHVTEKGSRAPVAVKLHIHGEAGEYLAPVDRNRIPNWGWMEDYAPDYANLDVHFASYIAGETVVDLPLGNVYVEVSKGFEIRPIRKVLKVGPRTRELRIELDRVLPWRDRGWVTADTHVHFLSPPTAQLEGAGEGVNVVNLLASQWGELMTNVGDFDGKTTFGSKEAGGDGEYLVRVGTENRQHILGHISLLGYKGEIIAPMTVGGADESAIGDPVEILLTEWARQCRAQGGLVVLPHFPNPRAEHAASIVSGDIDALEMTSWGNLYGGIDPYSLSDWYRYLNCGYFVPAVGGTDKMASSTAVGAVRTYAKLPRGREFTYDAWMDAVRAGETFVTYGPLLEFRVEGKPAGAWIDMKKNGGTVDVEWRAASVTIPMSRVDIVVNGEIVESVAVDAWDASGHCRLKLGKSSWVALLVRGHYPDKPELIATHSSPVMLRVADSPFFAAADALTILDQIEGAMAYLDTVGTRAEDARRKEMKLVLTAAYRTLHNRLHEAGYHHDHTHATDHPEHHR